MSEQLYLIHDWETRSEADLKKTGAWEYSKHSSTEILCLAWCIGTKENIKDADIVYWSPALPKTRASLNAFMINFLNPDIIKVAHNSIFEKVIAQHVLPKYYRAAKVNIRHGEWMCTATLARALAIPGSLEGATSALNLRHQKDTVGHRLMMKLSKPRKASKNNKAKWHCQKRDLMRLIEYCVADIEAERDLFLTLPELNETEKQVWYLDQKINFRGFEADRELVNQTLRMIEEEAILLNAETKEITHGRPSSTTQRDSVLKWLHQEGVFLPDLRAKTVADAIEAGLVEGNAKRILEIRQAISRTSTAKYHAFEARSRSDGRVRDILVYHTASTGRWGGAGVQPQNFPRGLPGLDTTAAAEILRDGDLEFVRLIYGNPMAVFSSCLRSVITAPKGRELFCADYAAIEARILFWVARHTDGVIGFFENKPMYEEMAQVIFKIENIEDVTKDQRFVGKQSFLGSGYGMGWKKFIQTCKNLGKDVDEETAQRAIYSYRELHSPVVKLWSNIEKASIEAVKRKGTKFSVNRTKWWVECLPGTKLEFLWCELPSGRKLAYFGPQIKYEEKWGEKRPVLYHYGINPLTRKWELSGTYGARLTENVVQAISRDLMADAMLRIESKEYDIILTVHDELVSEKDIDTGSVKEFENLMAQLPTWAEGAPVAVAGWSGERYRK